MQPLLALLRGEAPLADPAIWSLVLDLAESEHLLPWACSLTHELSLPYETRTRIAAAERDATIATFYFTSELKGILRAFHEAGLPVIPLKGPSLAERVYGSAALRQTRDLDLLVRKSELAKAETLLRSLGFVPVGWPDDYHQAWHRETTSVELHYDVENPLAFDFDVDTAWDRAQSGEFHGVSTWLLAPADEVLFLCLHAVRHRFERLSLLLDLKLAFAKLGPPAAGRMDDVVSLSIAMVRRFDPAINLPGPANAHLERLADRLYSELLTQPSQSRIALDWRALHAFYIEMEPTGTARLRRRLRHGLILATRVIGPDYAFADRFGLGRRWQARLLRPLRLLLRVQ